MIILVTKDWQLPLAANTGNKDWDETTMGERFTGLASSEKTIRRIQIKL